MSGCEDDPNAQPPSKRNETIEGRITLTGKSIALMEKLCNTVLAKQLNAMKRPLDKSTFRFRATYSCAWCVHPLN